MKEFKKIFAKVLKNKFIIFLLIVFVIELFLRFYDIPSKNPFGYDQVDNAWAAKDLIVNHKYPLVGMVAKANSGIYIGPSYYYIVSVFYFLTNLHPIASGLIAGLTSIFSFWTIYFVAQKLFNKEVALLAVIINTFNMYNIISDRVQWPVNFIAPISLLIFYLLYKIISGDARKIILLAIVVGFAFHIHVTAIFYLVIILLSTPFFSRSLEMVKYGLISIPLFLVWLIPNYIYASQNNFYGSNLNFYIGNYYHGFHATRFIQIMNDAFLQFDFYVIFEKLKIIKLFLVPLFIFAYLKKKLDFKKLKLVYLIVLWYLVPWILLAMFSGEISDYYYAINRYIGLIIISYLIYKVWEYGSFAHKGLVVVLLFAYCTYNLTLFFPYKDVGISDRMINAQKAIDEGRRVEFEIGVPETYFYYYLMMKQKGINVY